MEYPFSFLNSPESLQSIAATEFALNLWRLKYFAHPSSQTDPEFSFLKAKITSDEFISLPSRFENTIDEKLRQIGCQLREWIDFHKKAKLFDGGNEDFPDIFRRSFPSIVSSSDGTISFKGTAANIVKGNQFNDLEKYNVASNFCLEQDIRRIWPLVSRNSQVTRVVPSNLMYYWNRRMKSINDTVSAVDRFHKSYKMKNWPASEYFFHMLTHEEKLSNAIAILEKRDIKAQLFLLPKLNRDQAGILFIPCSRQIISVLTQNDGHFWHLRELWAIMKDAVFEKPHTFFDILLCLWKLVFHSDWDFTSCVQVNVFLVEVWASAPDELKAYASSHISKFLVSFTNSSDFSQYGHDMTFMLQLFGNESYEVRNRLWEKNWRNIVLRTKPSQLKEFIKLSLPDDQAIAAFNRRLVSDSLMKKRFRWFIQEGLLLNFCDYVRFFSKDSKHMQSVIKGTFRSNLDVIVSHNSSNLDNFVAFFRDVFSNVAKDIDKFKEDVILSKVGLESLHRGFEENCLEDFTKVIDIFAPSNKKLIKLKRKFLYYCREFLIKRQSTPFNREKWVMLLEWCTDDVDGFKQSLNIDEIFEERIIYNVRKWYFYIGEDFEFFDNFAKWYFVDDDARKKFKSDKLFNYSNVPTIAEFVKRKGRSCEMDYLAKWFFESDPVQVKKFRLHLETT